MIPNMPPEQGKVMEEKLKEAQEFATPMLLDIIWFKTAGKVEWEEYDEEVEKVVAREMAQ